MLYLAKEEATPAVLHNTNRFLFTSYTEEAIDEKVPVHYFITAFNDFFDLDNYGTGISKIGFAFVALHPKYNTQDEKIAYDIKGKRVNIILNLDYEVLLDAKPAQALDMMSSLYLEGIKELRTFNIQDFNLEQFIKDLKAFFQKEMNDE